MSVIIQTVMAHKQDLCAGQSHILLTVWMHK